MTDTPWLTVRRGAGPLLVSLPHTGNELGPIADRFVSAWRARKDVDWHIDALYDFVIKYDATIVRTALSRSLIDVNRDPSGASLYPGQATTELCPTTTFDGEPLYREGAAPTAAELVTRRSEWFEPYHDALKTELARLRGGHKRVVLYDCHSIRSRVPRLFEGELPIFNLGTNAGASCDPALRARIAEALAASGDSFVLDGRFKGGWITRSLGRPADGLHALQMELACRAYLVEPDEPNPTNWPAPIDAARAERTSAVLRRVFDEIAAWLRPL